MHEPNATYHGPDIASPDGTRYLLTDGEHVAWYQADETTNTVTVQTRAGRLITVHPMSAVTYRGLGFTR